MKGFSRHITVILLLAALFLAGCGPKPEVITEDLTPAEKRIEPIPPVAFYHYMSGVIAELEENYELAANYYQNALSHAPESYDIRVSLANILMGMRRHAEAWQVLKPLENMYAEAVLLKADCQRSLGNWPEAVKYYELSAKLAPNEMSPYWYLGNYYRQVGEYEKSIHNYERLSRLNNSPQVLNDLALLYLHTGDSSAAIETYKYSISSDPSTGNRDAYINMGRILSDQGKKEEAQAVLNEYIAQASSSIEARLELIEVYIEGGNSEEAIDEVRRLADEFPNRSRLLGQLGATALDLNEVELAKDLFRQQIELDQSDFVPYYYLGRIALFEEDLDAAKSNFEQVVSINDTIPDGWINLAEIYRMQDSLDQSIEVLQEAMGRVTINREDLSGFLARYYAQKEKYQGVINILEGVVDSSTTDLNLLFTYASAHERVGNFNRAVELFEQLLSENPEFHPALNYLGYMLADSGIRLQESKQMIEKALEYDSTNAAYLDSYGWVLFKMGELEKAEKYIKMAIDSMETADVIIYDHLAEIYFAQGRQEDARRLWEKALGIDPDNMAIREKLDR